MINRQVFLCILPVIGDARIGHACADSTIRAHQREELTAHGSTGKTAHCTIVYKYWSFRHHYKV